MKILRFLGKNLPFILVLFVLIFIPLYPKIPLIGVNNTWVYIRLDDVVMAVTYAVFGLYLLFRKATLKTPLTIPIILFWLVGIASTVIAIVYIFPTLVNVFPHLAILNYLRRIEYIGIFFVAFSSIYSPKQLKYVVGILLITLLAVVAYGVGQKYLGWPAYLTGNEEFAKGIPLRLSETARIPSTFAGHYDLAAWLVVAISIMAAMVFAVKKIWWKLIYIFASFSGLILLLLTASRVSYLVYLVTITFLLVIQKQKKWIVPVLLLSILLLGFFDTISSRLLRTVTQVELVVDARTGKAVGIVSTEDKTGEKKIVIEDKQSTGEQLPQGTGFINIPGTGSNTTSQVTYRRTKITADGEKTDSQELQGDFVIKKALAYDVSFTTRFQGTWPRAINAFLRNIWTGSGYSSISLASDGNYLRILGEVGLVGLLSFGFIFLMYGIYIAKGIGKVTSKPVKAFVLGVTAGIFGVALNAILIDVFEASKVAYPLWALIGLAVAFVALYQKEKINYIKELKKIFSSIWAISVYLLLGAFGVFSMIIPNYFVGDDFTWLRWVGDCKKVVVNGWMDCQAVPQTLLSYFTDSNNFFYRPGTKSYFYGMYSFFWLNQGAYHVVSLLTHFLVSVSVYILALKLLKKKLFAFYAALIFLVFSVHYESVFWISVTGHLFAALGVMISLITYIYWREYKKWYLLPISFIATFGAMFFHEFAVVTILLIASYDALFILKKVNFSKIVSLWYYLVYLALAVIYLVMRFMAQSHWQGGDYTYNLAKLPFNAIGNLIGYVGVTFLGPNFQSVIDTLRVDVRNSDQLIGLGIILAIVIIGSISYAAKRLYKKYDFRVFLFSLLFFVITLLPFLGLGNSTARYAYLPSVAAAILLGLILLLAYNGIKRASKVLAFVVVGAIALAYIGLNIYQLNQLNKDWTRASAITYNLIYGFNNYFNFNDGNKTPENPVFYFVDVPIKTGTAWVFPVGLNDGLWFTFQNTNLNVINSKNLDEAFNASEGSASARVFQFLKDGSVEEVSKQTIINETK